MWLTLVFAVIYFFFGDFFTDNYEDVIEPEEDDKKTEDIKKNSE